MGDRGQSIPCILVVEDEYLVAMDIAESLQELGYEVLGPAGSVDQALGLLNKEGDRLTGALLDINIRNERVYPVADALAKRGIPFAFATGYDAGTIPDRHAEVPRCEKPVNRSQLARLLSRH